MKKSKTPVMLLAAEQLANERQFVIVVIQGGKRIGTLSLDYVFSTLVYFEGYIEFAGRKVSVASRQDADGLAIRVNGVAVRRLNLGRPRPYAILRGEHPFICAGYYRSAGAMLQALTCEKNLPR